MFQAGHDVAVWAAKHLRGPRVALAGRLSAATLLALAREGRPITAYVSDPSYLEKWLASRVVDHRNVIDLHGLTDIDADGPCPSINTVAVVGFPNETDGSGSLLERLRGFASAGSRFMLTVPDFGSECSRVNGFDISSFIGDARLLLTPVHLSVTDDTLRFIGEFGEPDADAWSVFESEAWPVLLRDGIRSVAVRSRSEVAGLLLRLERLRGSMPYTVGAAVIAAARAPATFWRLPLTLWRLYLSRRSRSDARAVKSRHEIVFPPIPLPQPTASSARPVAAAILDTFSDYCLRYELDLVRLTPEHWRREIETSSPAFLLVESAWAGNEGRWRGLIVHSQMGRNPLFDLVSYCREKGITTVFWNKEDPPNFDFFIAAARQFDVIFTSDANCVPHYREICGHDRVHVMPFAAQPRIHNPCRDKAWPRYPICFAGGWKGDAYEGRTESVPILLDPALAFGLHIMDRNLRKANSRPSFRFPERYQEAIKGSLAYREMLTAYRCYDVMLNANSVTESPTMCSRRVFEALACATPVVSLESVAIQAMLGEHVRVTRTREETAAHLEALLGDDEMRVREGHLAYRHVHSRHTYRHRVEKILREVGLGDIPSAASVVTVLGVLRDAERLESLLDDYVAQSHREKQLLVVVVNDGIDTDAVESRVRGVGNAEMLHFGSLAFGGRLNQAVAEATGTYICLFEDADKYCEHYIADMMLAADFSGAEVLGKSSYFSYDQSRDLVVLRNEGEDHAFVESVAASTIVARREAMLNLPFVIEARDFAGSFFSQATKSGLRIYSADRFNYLEVLSNDIEEPARAGQRGELPMGRRALPLNRVSV